MGLFRIFLILLLASCLNTAKAEILCVNRVLARMLIDYAGNVVENRRDTEKEFWQLYKNNRAFSNWVLSKTEFETIADTLVEWRQIEKAGLSFKNIPPQEVSLLGDDILEPARRFDLKRFGFQVEPNSNFSPITTYDYRVLTLRQGDTVSFGDRKFKLGKFLGAGNATHIYELQDFPGQAIRIPFLPYRKRVDLKDLKDRFQLAIEFAGQYIRKRKEAEIKKIPIVKLFENPKNYRFAVVEKVLVKMTGTEFLDLMEKGYGVHEFSKLAGEKISNPNQKALFLELVDYIHKGHLEKQDCRNFFLKTGINGNDEWVMGDFE